MFKVIICWILEKSWIFIYLVSQVNCSPFLSSSQFWDFVCDLCTFYCIIYCCIGHHVVDFHVNIINRQFRDYVSKQKKHFTHRYLKGFTDVKISTSFGEKGGMRLWIMKWKVKNFVNSYFQVSWTSSVDTSTHFYLDISIQSMLMMTISSA